MELGGHIDIESLCHCLTKMKEVILPLFKLQFRKTYSIKQAFFSLSTIRENLKRGSSSGRWSDTRMMKQ